MVLTSLSNTELRKKQKRNMILSVIRSGDEVSRFEVKKTTQYSMSTVLRFVDDLVAQGLVLEEESTKNGVGRKPIWLKINPEGCYFIGVDFNAERIYVSILDFALEVVYRMKLSCGCFHVDQLQQALHESIRGALETLGKKRAKVSGIGLGVPGYVDKDRGVGRYYPHITGFANVPLRQPLEQEFQLPVLLENNINAMSVDVSRRFSGLGDYVFISIRSGIRMSLHLNGQLYPGGQGLAGEIGHLPVPGCQRLCACGKRGCLDTEASNTGLLTKLNQGLQDNRFSVVREMLAAGAELSMETLVNSVRQGDPESVAIVQEAARYVGASAAAAAAMLNPQTVVIAGEIARAGDVFSRVVKETIRQGAIFNNERTSLKVITLDPYAAASGAAKLVYLDAFRAKDSGL